MTEIQKAPETTTTPERGLSLHPSVKTALLLFMTTLAGCMQKTDLSLAEPSNSSEVSDAGVCYEDKSSLADYQSDKGDKYEECLTSKPAPHISEKSSSRDYTGYDKQYPTCEQV